MDGEFPSRYYSFSHRKCDVLSVTTNPVRKPDGITALEWRSGILCHRIWASQKEVKRSRSENQRGETDSDRKARNC
jgi:hypothetical protein